jgi:hypothetical protein
MTRTTGTSCDPRPATDPAPFRLTSNPAHGRLYPLSESGPSPADRGVLDVLRHHLVPPAGFEPALTAPEGTALYGPDQRERAPAGTARTHIGHSPPSGGQRARDKAVTPGQGNFGGAEAGLRGYACCSDRVYSMRMARVNITVPDDLLNRARAAGLNVSRLAAAALADELDRQAKLGELDAYLADLDAELGPVPQHELKAAREWADAVLPAGRGGSARQARSA